MTTKPEIQPDKLEVLPWMDAAANKFAKYLAQGIKIIPSDYETDLAYDLAREIAAHAPKQDTPPQQLREQVDIVKELAVAARNRGYHEIGACFEYSASVIERVLNGTRLVESAAIIEGNQKS